ncbi:MAG: hypothetical protein K2J60_00165 [Acetatifactor sp.]|nr:hypothetical protein [Acetatifactor sp.]
MRGLFCPRCKAKNNEEYRAVLKKRKVIFYLFILVGLATDGLVLFLNYCTRIIFLEYLLGYLLGLGVGLIFGGVIGLIQISRRMANEEKLKEFRLKETDERELEVDSLAYRATAKLLLVVLYVLLIVAGVFGREELLYVCFGLVGIFLIGYAAFRKYYGTKI